MCSFKPRSKAALSKAIHIGILLVIALAISSSAFAEGYLNRPFRPYQPEEFGGQRRGKDGVYGNVEIIYWKLDGPRNVASLNTALNLTEIPSDFTNGTRITFGNRSGHHGWRFTGYGLSGLGGTVTRTGGLDWSEQTKEEVLINISGTTIPGAIGGSPVVIPGVQEVGSYNHSINVREIGNVAYTSRTKVMDLDLAWTYRTHPLRWGELEFFAAAKYRDLTDRLSFTNTENSFVYRLTETIASVVTVTGATSPSIQPLSPPTLAATGPAAVSEQHYLSSQVDNRMVGPNLGFSLSRRNQRWTFSVAPSAFLGVNSQSFTFRKRFDTSFSDVTSTTGANALNENDLYGLVKRAGASSSATQPQSTANLNDGSTIYYKRHRTVFAPGGTLQLAAGWQWTDAVGVRLGFDTTLMNNIARGSTLQAKDRYRDITDAEGNPGKQLDGYDFSLRNQGDTVLLFGFSVGLDIRR